uniref:Holliday junction branch migration complex subunit RuvA n=1 Tax=uncultured Acidobacteriales bacterium HF0200_23L05 TaxID=710732 RepID=E0XUI8_9BACT|nr:holliday junction resolvasome, DNA-binding subunit [uncultured Acidobacteriales bacterium HF0200_23L05]|tara:strand:- start:762 stop:1358 length:597 start_codon:yes stop_codon:yes gene_type:complete
MIATLHGVLTEKNPSRLVVDISGVGYEVSVPLSTFYALGELGAEVDLRIHTHVREDALSLFGFATQLEIDLFGRLIAISGVGPRLALAVLSGLEPPDLLRAIQDSDIVRLQGIPGVGKKTAERISLELKDKLPSNVLTEGETKDFKNGTEQVRRDVMSALLNLGYHRPLAERAVKEVLTGEVHTFEETLRLALRELAK